MYGWMDGRVGLVQTDESSNARIIQCIHTGVCAACLNAEELAGASRSPGSVGTRVKRKRRHLFSRQSPCIFLSLSVEVGGTILYTVWVHTTRQAPGHSIHSIHIPFWRPTTHLECRKMNENVCTQSAFTVPSASVSVLYRFPTHPSPSVRSFLVCVMVMGLRRPSEPAVRERHEVLSKQVGRFAATLTRRRLSRTQGTRSPLSLSLAGAAPLCVYRIDLRLSSRFQAVALSAVDGAVDGADSSGTQTAYSTFRVLCGREHCAAPSRSKPAVGSHECTYLASSSPSRQPWPEVYKNNNKSLFR
ncbi:hypothetical protein BDW22DRAFT_699443 [Trametopsis cervina]|nr:hypothetical protein BDW22DRAFT_699443 [Trametopsis cervina]